MFNRKLALALVVILSLVFSGVAMAATGSGVEPVLFENWQSGNAIFENDQAGGCGAFAYKVDDWDEDDGMDGTYVHAGNTITILNSDGGTFDWQSEWPVCAVIVKAGTGAYIYYYDGAYSDTGLVAPEGKDISHVTFAFNEPDMCYADETAWTFGPRYNQRGGNWAMYTAYDGVSKTVDVIAGQTYVAGTATFAPAADGYVDITISLANGFIFYYDLGDDLDDNNIKVQGYYMDAPKGNPNPGGFAYKAMADVNSTSYTITVPFANFYGVHLDLAQPVSCE